MVQIVNMPAAPQTGPQKALGAVGESFANITSAGLQQKFNEMQTQRAQQAQMQNYATQNESIVKAFGMHDLLREGPIYAEPKSVLQAMMEHQKQLYEHGGNSRLSSLQDTLIGTTGANRQPSYPQAQSSNGNDQQIQNIPQTSNAPEKIEFDETGKPNIPVEKPLNEVQQLQERQKQAIDLYNKETDPTVKKQMYSAIQANQKAIRDTKKDLREERNSQYKLEKEPRDFIKKLNDEYTATLKKRPIYKTLLSKAPELQPHSVLRKFLMERFGLPAGMMLDKTGQALDKVSQQLLRGIGSDYKGRILQSEVENYMKSNPSLLNTPEGIMTLSKMAMEFDNVAEDKWKMANALKKEYRDRGETLPEDFESEITERSAELYDKAYNNIEKILGKNGIESADQEMIPITSPDGKPGKIPRKYYDKAISSGGFKPR